MSTKFKIFYPNFSTAHVHCYVEEYPTRDGGLTLLVADDKGNFISDCYGQYMTPEQFEKNLNHLLIGMDVVLTVEGFFYEPSSIEHSCLINAGLSVAD